MHSVFVDLFPLILCAVFWIAMSCLSFSLLRSKKRFHSMQTSGEAARIRQTDVFRRSTVVLLALGAAGGFLPSIFMMLLTGKVWSVNHQAPHSMVDVYLIMHIPLAIAWSVLVALQLWSADIGRRRSIHKSFGWLTLTTGILGIGLIGGIIWPLVNDFSDGLDSPNAGAGIYTMAMGMGVIVNGTLAGLYAKRRDLAKHKDFIIMTVFWTLDPGLHRLYMWLMRLFGGDTWAPEQTAGLGIAIAKLPANLTLIAWAIVVGILARRLNSIFLYNITGQFLLWCLGTSAVISAIHNTQTSITIVALSAIFFVSFLVIAGFEKRTNLRGNHLF